MQDSQGLNVSLEERVRRRLILAGILPKFSDLGQGVIGEAIEAAGAGQFGRLHKEALKLHDRIRYNKARSLSMDFSEYMRSLIRKELEGGQQRDLAIGFSSWSISLV